MDFFNSTLFPSIFYIYQSYWELDVKDVQEIFIYVTKVKYKVQENKKECKNNIANKKKLTEFLLYITSSTSFVFSFRSSYVHFSTIKIIKPRAISV